MSDKPVLLLIVPTLHQGGQERVVIRSARLLQNDFDVTITVFDSSDKGYDTEGLNIVDLNVPASSGLVFKAVNILKRRVRLAALKKKLKPDISYSYGPSANIINALTAVPGEATWCGLRNYMDMTAENQMRLFIRKSDLIVCCSRDIETAVIRRFGLAGADDENDYGAPSGKQRARTCVLYNLYDYDEIKRLAIAEEPDPMIPLTMGESGKKIKYIMTMGRDDDQKMYWHMIKVFKLVLTRVPEARLVIMGSGTFESFKRMAKNLGIYDQIIFAGQQSNPYKYLKYGDIFWMTSRNEGFPNALVEAMAMGLVPVSTNCFTGPAEILIEYGDVFSCSGKLREIQHSRHVISASDSQVESRPVAIYGEYGILTPAMSRERDMDFAHFEDEHYNLAEVLIDLLGNEKMISDYRNATGMRSLKYSYEEYRKSFMYLASVSTGKFR
ncbi:MAG: glycosyltransferase [Lachnospiraceae bacterium]|nr:glycosyltransferase [Lachnospiraceae bacterium]MBQ8947902.1 glycosyltransferase [Lachnospiraceae bacterium]